MRTVFRNIIILIGCTSIAIYFGSCDRGAPEPRKTPGLPTAFVMGTQLEWKTNNEMMLEIDVAAITEDCKDFTLIPDSAFHIESTSSVFFEIDSIERLFVDNSLPYSNILLINQSESPLYLDAFNFRVRAVNRFFTESSRNNLNQVSIAYFARNSSTINNYKIFTDSTGNPFGGTYHEKLIMESEINTEELSGSSNIYDACMSMMRYIDTFAVNEQRFVTVYTYNIDDSYGLNANKLIDSALNRNISINIISIGYHAPLFADICSRTGGFLMETSSFFYTEMENKGPLIIASLDRILQKNVHLYRIHLKVKRNLNFYNGFYLRPDFYVRYTDASGNIVINNPLKFYYRLSL